LSRNIFRIRGLAAGVALAAISLAAPANAAPADRHAVLPAQVLQAMQRDLGLSPDQAQAQLAAQGTARRLDTQLTAQLGADFAGDWYDQRSGKLVVAVTSAKRVAEVRAAGAEARLVAHGKATLDGIMAELDKLAATDKAAVSNLTAWHVDPETNAVVVTVLAGKQAGRALAGLARYGNAVRVERESTTASVTADYLDGGDPYNGCSVGFNAFAGSTRYFVTAGHCGVSGNQTYGAGGNWIGPFVGSSFPGNDYALVRVDNTGYWIQGPWVDAYNGGFYNVHAWYWSAPPPGLTVCKSGRTTGLTCGIVRASSETVNTDRGTVYELTRHTACVERGDSGGANISWDSAGNTYAEGVTSAANLLADGRCRSKAGSENSSWFQYVGEAISAYGISLYTA
jgi:streptogrisin C